MGLKEEHIIIVKVREFGDAGHDADGGNVQPMYRATMKTGTLNDCYAEFTVEDFSYPDDWAPIMKGTLKWDGCMNWSAGDENMIHFCGLMDSLEFVKIFKELYEMGPEVMPRAWMM